MLVTGGGKGIGHAIASKFYNDGAEVFVIDRDAKLLEDLKKDMPKVNVVGVDLLDWVSTKKVVEELAPLDHVVNNAGIAGEGRLLDLNPDTFDKVIGVNVKAVLNVSQAFVQGIINTKSKGQGRTIVNISSIADSAAMWGLAGYCTSKGALTMLTKCMALEFGEYDIRVNCVNPTFMATDLVKNIPLELHKRAHDLQNRLILKNRALEPSDVADLVLFLSSPLSSMITGAAYPVEAGAKAI